MTKINCQKGQFINSLNPFLILIQLLFVILISRSEVGAAGGVVGKSLAQTGDGVVCFVFSLGFK